jgi:YfiH family protein
MKINSIILPGDRQFNLHIAWSTRDDGPMNLIGKEYFAIPPDIEAFKYPEAGDAERRANRAAFLSRLEKSNIAQVVPKLVHGAEARYVSAPNAYLEDLQCDALTSDTPNLALTVGFADCVPVCLFDPAASCYAVIHAGWRGIAAGIVENTMSQMLSLGAHRSHLQVFIGPGARKCCYEVSPEVATAVDGLPHVGHLKIDLPDMVLARLVACGVPVENVREEGSCTICATVVDSKNIKKPLYYSYRREKKSDPLDTSMLVAWLQ